jgi:hypothetical protein
VKATVHPKVAKTKNHQAMKVTDQQDKLKTNIHLMMKRNQIIHIMKKQNINQIDGKVEPNQKILFAHH